jgi:hypothetical protein
MSQQTSDQSVLGKIEALLHEEQHLYGGGRCPTAIRCASRRSQVELDQCWDLLRQRRARREFGQDPNAAKVRPASVVERYEQ